MPQVDIARKALSERGDFLTENGQNVMSYSHLETINVWMPRTWMTMNEIDASSGSEDFQFILDRSFFEARSRVKSHLRKRLRASLPQHRA